MKRTRPSLFLLLLLSLSFATFAQADLVGSGHAVRYDGVDDYIDLGDIYDDVNFPITICAWVYLEPNDKYILPIFASQDNAPLYNGFWFCLTSSNLFFEYGDGRGEQSAAFRRGKSAVVSNLQNRWIFVSAVVKSGNDIQLFANGQDVGGSYTGSSDQPMASSYPSDIAKIGYFYTNSTIHRFVGTMDELRIWNRALTESEIRQTMCRRLDANDPGLIGYWNFDETSGDVLNDLSPKGHNGVLKGNPTRIFSGAPIGDESYFLYTNDWSGKTLSADDTLSVGGITGNSYGVHLYKVNHIPSQTGGLNVSDLTPPYYGVFVAGDGNDNTFDLTFKENTVCTSFQRNDNSEPSWYRSGTFSGIHLRTEIIPSLEQTDLNVNLGDDALICDKTSFVLNVDMDPAMKTFLWNTGQTSQSITVNSSGIYSVEVRQDCMVDRDSILITILNSPPAFSLGTDEEACSLKPRTLNTGIEPDGFDFTWQDGSKDPSFQISDFGTYWVKVQNLCGVSADTITFRHQILKDLKSYNFISPGNSDDYNEYFVVDKPLVGAQLEVFNRWGKLIYQSPSYQNDWDAEGVPAGVYFYMLSGECFEPQKGTLTVMR